MSHPDVNGRGPAKGAVKRINVALQGGGAYGAYAWGVLDRLLEDERIEIEAVSGTSAGAMNAIVMAEGLVEGGRKRAREQLAEFWQAVSMEAMASPIQRSPLDVLASSWSLDFNPALAWFDIATRIVSPYQFNPLNLNPLRELLLREVDFEKVRGCNHMQLFISATNVRTGQGRIFTGAEVTADAVMASACLPFLFQAVMIDGEPYWDGGYMGNPVLEPFFGACQSQDVLLVQVNPIRRDQTPMTAREIMDRTSEISFNASLIRELRHVEFINDCVRRGELSGTGYREIFMHLVGGGPTFSELPSSAKLNAEWAFLTMLRDNGRRDVEAWLASSYDAIGKRPTMELAGYRPVRRTTGAPSRPTGRRRPAGA